MKILSRVTDDAVFDVEAKQWGRPGKGEHTQPWTNLV